MAVRQERLRMADMRAIEEQAVRQSMHGGGRYIGMGATPSMGLSQYRGGKQINPRGLARVINFRKKGSGHYEDSDSETDDEDEYCEDDRHGGATSTVLTRYVPKPIIRAPVRGPIRTGPIRGPIRTGPLRIGDIGDASTALIPYKPPTSTTIGISTSRPSLPADYYANLFNRGRPPRGTIQSIEELPNLPTKLPSKPSDDFLVPVKPSRGLTQRMLSRIRANPRLAALLAAGASTAILIAALAASESGSSGGPSDGSSSGPSSGPTTDGRPVDEGGYDFPDYGGVPDENDGDGSGYPSPPSDWHGTLQQWYAYIDQLRSGNLAQSYFERQKKMSGKGRKMKSGHDGRSARAEIVRRVMHEYGCSLPQASKYVKEHNLY